MSENDACEHPAEAGGRCGKPGTRAYLTGRKCPDHTPAVVAGRTEPTPPDQRKWENEHPPAEPLDFTYGTATSDPLGRLGWSKNAGLPKRDRA